MKTSSSAAFRRWTRLVVEREVEDDEEVVGVLVDLRPLPLREDVLDVELVEAEALGDERRLLRGRLVDEDPGEAVGGELRDAGLRPRGDDARSAGVPPPDAGPG